MEHPPTPIPQTSPTSEKRRDNNQDLLTSNRPRSPLTGLSSSEPFLRFPRPVGNRRLANWISTSNPDIMRVTTSSEHSGIAESTYELVGVIDVESHDEDRDEHYTESVSESVDSLDIQPPEDVRSLADTEHTCDDESFVDEVEALSHSFMPGDQSAEDDDVVHVPSVVDEQHNQLPPHTSDVSESEEEAESRSSIEYTQYSLKTPSIMTPEASRVFEKLSRDVVKPAESAAAVCDWMDTTRDALTRAWDYTTDAAYAALPGFLFAIAFSLLVPTLYPSTVEFSKPAVSVVTTTITATATPLVIYASYATPANTISHKTTSAKGMGLIAMDEKAPDEWLFSSKKPDIEFTPLAPGSILIHVAPEVKQAWLGKKNCVSVVATRDSERVEMDVTSPDDGFLINFPKRETHGVVKVLIRATCRPTVSKAVRIHFGKGIMEEAYEITKNLASDISGLVPVAAQEAERCLETAKKSFVLVSDNLASSVTTVSDSLVSRVTTSVMKLHKLLDRFPSSSIRHVQSMAREVPTQVEAFYRKSSELFQPPSGIPTEIQEGILDAKLFILTARISAKMWWLKVTGQIAEHQEYGDKAREYVDKKRWEGRNKIREAPAHSGDAWKSFFASKKKMSNRSSSCHMKSDKRHGRDIHLCKAEA